MDHLTSLTSTNSISAGAEIITSSLGSKYHASFPNLSFCPRRSPPHPLCADVLNTRCFTSPRARVNITRSSYCIFVSDSGRFRVTSTSDWLQPFGKPISPATPVHQAYLVPTALHGIPHAVLEKVSHIVLLLFYHRAWCPNSETSHKPPVCRAGLVTTPHDVSVLSHSILE